MTEIERQISAEIRLNGPVPFSRFMETALYCPVYGFYEKEADTIGRAGHFYTSVSVGPLFGELLAFKFAQWIDGRRVPPEAPVLVEAGAHDGALASDILGWFHFHRPDLYERLGYVVIEPSSRRAAWQNDRLGVHARRLSRVKRVEDLEAVQPGRRAGLDAIIFSNELLDAFPVHRLAWVRQERRWAERGVTLENGRLAWCTMEIQSPDLAGSLPGEGNPLLEYLPDGYVIDVCPAATRWWVAAASVLHSGVMLAIDYGFADEDWLSPARTGGTLRAYRGHQCSDRVLEAAGEQDLTAHVNFPEIIKAGEDAGLETEVFQPQGRFLTRVATEIPPGHSFAPPWDAARNRQFATLAHPDHLGHTFKVLVQGKSLT